MNKILKRVLVGVGAFVGIIILGAGSYVGYVILSYNRIGNCDLIVDSKSNLNSVTTGETYKALSYNIGFGAYSQDFTFFLDTGYDEDGNETCGHSSKAKSKEEVVTNITGAFDTVLAQDADFVCFQEVDTDSTRSHHINQDEEIQNKFPSFDHVHAKNFHTAFLPYPLYDMHGYVNSGLTVLSKYKIEEAKRHEYTVSDSLSKFIDLDRCFASTVIKVENGKNLYLCNSHMSAYDTEGIREKQVKELNNFLIERKKAGDYVIVGGDWNHDLLTFNPDYSYNETDKRPFGETKKSPDWVNLIFNEEGKTPFEEGFKIVASDNSPSCRNNDIEYTPGKTYVCCVDGFLVSDNVEIVSHENIVTKNGNRGYDGFAYSDHEPVMIEFKLN